MTTLLYNRGEAHDAGVDQEPDEDMRRLGIAFTHGKSVDGDATFYGCENVPAKLPPYVRRTEPVITYVFKMPGKEST